MVLFIDSCLWVHTYPKMKFLMQLMEPLDGFCRFLSF